MKERRIYQNNTKGFWIPCLKILLGHNNSDVPSVTLTTKVAVYKYVPARRVGQLKPLEHYSTIPFLWSRIQTIRPRKEH
jgi:hypothetical protein